MGGSDYCMKDLSIITDGENKELKKCLPATSKTELGLEETRGFVLGKKFQIGIRGLMDKLAVNNKDLSPTECPSISHFSTPSSSTNPVPVKFTVSCCLVASPAAVVNVNVDKKPSERNEVRLGLPSKGRMATDTLDLLKDCQLSVRQSNPRQYVAEIPQISNLEVWFQRPKDVVRKLVSGDLDLGIVGLDIVQEYGQGNDDLIIVHDSLDYGDCRLSLAIPKYGIFENINSLKELAQMPQWTPERPLRVATGFTYLGPKFMKENGLNYVTFSTADGALEAAPACSVRYLPVVMGIADAIVDLVSSGTTLRENNLKEIEGGVILESQAVLVASRKSLMQRKGVLDITHEMLERLEAHLRAVVTANMRGSSAEEVADRVLSQPSLSGLQIGGSGVLVSPLTYIFDEETPRWRQLLSNLGL
ncbi:hypothetical protein DH2020_045081 [Rehmannia glutinosa]|uniref:ATP phosphoribosyltransferase n=1 Tax=Rehmannia glutinosa TaxID=99300 RepID=A0ABR0UF33_REHGL